MSNEQALNEVEINVLSSMIMSADSCDHVLSVLEVNDFVNPKHAIVFETIKELYKNNKAIDITTVSEGLMKRQQLDSIGGFGYLTNIIEKYITSANLKQHMEIIIERSTKRELAKVVSKINKSLTGDTPLNDIIAGAENAIIQVTTQRGNEELMPISRYVDEVIHKIEQLQRSSVVVTGVGSGLQDLDANTCGFQKGDLIILAARPSMGKTALALNFALNAAEAASKKKIKNREKPPMVAVFSLEMPREQLLHRMIACQGILDLSKLRQSSQMDKADWNKMSATGEKLKSFPIIIDDTPGLRLLELQSKLRKMTREYDVQLIVIDYLQLLIGNRDSESRQQEVSSISRSLKILARELSVPIICLSQLSRLVERREEKRPLMSDLRESGAIEQDADLIMFLYREDYYKEKNEENSAPSDESNIAEIIISKHRNGPTGRIMTVFSSKYGKFNNYHSKTKDKD